MSHRREMLAAALLRGVTGVLPLPPGMIEDIGRALMASGREAIRAAAVLLARVDGGAGPGGPPTIDELHEAERSAAAAWKRLPPPARRPAFEAARQVVVADEPLARRAALAAFAEAAVGALLDDPVLVSDLVPGAPGSGSLAPGTVFAGRYRLEQELGRGGFGTVYRATHLELGRQVALKVLDRQLAADEESCQRFLREVQVATSFVHRYAVQLRDAGRDPASGCLYFTMDLVEGRTLRQLLDGGTMDEPRLVPLAQQLAEVLDHIHRLGFLHRDLKPENVMVTATPLGEEVRLLDFGITRAVSSAQHDVTAITRAGLTMGTLGYMSPEQAEGARLDPRSDVYALGVLLYEALSGRRPVDPTPGAENVRQSLLTNLLTRPPRDLAEVAPWVSTPLRQLVMGMLARDAAERPGSAAEVLQALGTRHDLVADPAAEVAAPRPVFAPATLPPAVAPAAPPPVAPGPTTAPAPPLDTLPPAVVSAPAVLGARPARVGSATTRRHGAPRSRGGRKRPAMLGAAAATLGLAAALALDLLELRARLDLRPPGLVVEEVATSTIAPVITLRGVVADWTLSEVHVGSVPLDMAALRSRDGAFEHPLALPALGPHRITVRARDRAGHETVVEHTVERRPIDLQLRVDAPAQGSWVSSSTVVAGTVSARGVPAAELLVSLAGRTVVPAPDGTFSAAVSLPAGEQTVELTARGRLTEVVTRRAVRVDPTAPVLRLAYRADPLLLGPDLVTPTETLVLEGLVEDGAGAARLLVNDVPGDVVAGEPFLREVPLGHALTRLVIVAEDPAGNRTPAVELQALRLPRPARSTTEGISGTLSGDGLIEAEAGPATYRIEVPAGAARLVVHVVGRPGPDVDLYLRHGATMASWAEAEHVAAADAIRQEVLLVDGTTDPPLRPGDYYLDIATRGAGRLAVAVRFDLPADDPLVVAGRAIERLARGAPDEALSALDVPPARDPARAAAFHLLRGFVQEARGDMAAAEAECTDGLSLAPRSWSLRFRRAKAREMQDRLDEALEDARAALGLDPPPAGGARLHTFRGELFHWRREYEAAIDEFIAAARLLPGEPTYHENLANSRRLAGQLEAAIADYTAALERQPGRASALNGRGLAHYSRSDLEPALTDFTAAAAAAPENAVYRTNRGIVLARKGDLAGAVRTFDEVLAAVADHVPALIERGRAHARLEQVARATADFEAALRLEPRNVEALVARGNLRHDAKQYAAAIDDYSVAIEVAPEDPVLWSNRGNSRRLLGDHDGALTDYQRSLELDPDAADAHFGRGRSAIAKGDYATAIAALERAVELDASSYVTHSWLGWALYLNGAHGDALRCYDEAVRLAPSDAVIHYERGQVRYARRDYTGAHEDFSRAIALDSSSPYFYDWRGAARRELGKAAEAIADFDAAIQRDGKFAQAYLNRGCMHYRAGAYSRAQADFETVLRLEPRRATAHNWLGNVFHSQTQYTQAIECYSRAIEIDGRDPVYFSNRGYSRHLAGDHRRALLDFTRAIELDSAYASAYERRALAYRALNDVAKAEQDERKGRELKR